MPTLSKPLVLTIDLDDSFAESPAEDRAELVNAFETSEESVRLIYTSHENVEKLVEIAAKAELPVPEMFLADSGTTALKGDGSGTIEPLQRNVTQLWPGKDSVTKALGAIDGVTLLEDAAPCRQSFNVETDEALELCQTKADELGCSIEQREGNSYDVLPYGVDKGASIGRWIVQENVTPSHVVSFTQAKGDAMMFGRGWRGGVLGGAGEELKEGCKRFHNVRIMKTSGARGVLDCLHQFGWL